MWIVIGTHPNEMHIVPFDDLIEHEETVDCICGPAVIYLDDGLKTITHSSLDGREQNEPDWKGT
jgi:hypothetical protein